MSRAKITIREALWAKELFDQGNSVRSIAKLKWREWGYASPAAANEGLRAAFRALGVQPRDRIEQVTMTMTLHGKARRSLQGTAVNRRYRNEMRRRRRAENRGWESRHSWRRTAATEAALYWIVAGMPDPPPHHHTLAALERRLGHAAPDTG